MAEVTRYRRRTGDRLSPHVQPCTAQIIEMSSAGTLVQGSLMLDQHHQTSPGAV